MQKEEEKQPLNVKIPEHLREQLLAAIESEINAEFIQRHKINERSPSFPYDHRTMANRDSLKTGPKDAFTVGKHKMYITQRLIEMLRADLS